MREDKLHQVYSSMQTGQAESGMMTMNQSLVKLANSGQITKHTALDASYMPDEIAKLMGMAKAGV
jgi:twitching motility protein PilT